MTRNGGWLVSERVDMYIAAAGGYVIHTIQCDRSNYADLDNVVASSTTVVLLRKRKSGLEDCADNLLRLSCIRGAKVTIR